MGKYEKKKEKKSRKGFIWVVLLLVAAAMLAVFVMPQILYRLSGDTDAFPDEPTEPAPVTEQIEETQQETQGNTPADTEADASLEKLEFPIELENGQLVLESLFEFEGINPDCSYESGSSIATVTVMNTSGEYLAEAKLTLVLADGRSVEFLVNELPAGKTAMAFAADNTQLETAVDCVDVSCETVWIGAAEAEPEGISVSVSGTTVSIVNNAGRDISALTVYCREPFDEVYFGGKAHVYTINNISADGTAAVEALDCILGLAEVVRVEINE